MGPLTYPSGAVIYVDTMVVVYTVEQHPEFGLLLRGFWEQVSLGAVRAVSSQLTLLETLVLPLRNQDMALERDYDAFLARALLLLDIDEKALRRGARIRAATRLPTPDAIHAATALTAGCDGFLTNDDDFRRVEGLTVTVLRDLVA